MDNFAHRKARILVGSIFVVALISSAAMLWVIRLPSSYYGFIDGPNLGKHVKVFQHPSAEEGKRIQWLMVHSQRLCALVWHSNPMLQDDNKLALYIKHFPLTVISESADSDMRRSCAAHRLRLNDDGTSQIIDENGNGQQIIKANGKLVPLLQADAAASDYHESRKRNISMCNQEKISFSIDVANELVNVSGTQTKTQTSSNLPQMREPFLRLVYTWKQLKSAVSVQQLRSWQSSWVGTGREACAGCHAFPAAEASPFPPSDGSPMCAKFKRSTKSNYHRTSNVKTSRVSGLLDKCGRLQIKCGHEWQVSDVGFELLAFRKWFGQRCTLNEKEFGVNRNNAMGTITLLPITKISSILALVAYPISMVMLQCEWKNFGGYSFWTIILSIAFLDQVTFACLMAVFNLISYTDSSSLFYTLNNAYVLKAVYVLAIVNFPITLILYAVAALNRLHALMVPVGLQELWSLRRTRLLCLFAWLFPLGVLLAGPWNSFRNIQFYAITTDRKCLTAGAHFDTKYGGNHDVYRASFPELYLTLKLHSFTETSGSHAISIIIYFFVAILIIYGIILFKLIRGTIAKISKVSDIKEVNLEVIGNTIFVVLVLLIPAFIAAFGVVAGNSFDDGVREGFIWRTINFGNEVIGVQYAAFFLCVQNPFVLLITASLFRRNLTKAFTKRQPSVNVRAKKETSLARHVAAAASTSNKVSPESNELTQPRRLPPLTPQVIDTETTTV